MAVLKVPMNRRPTGLSMHGTGVVQKTAAAERTKWLMSLSDREKQRRADGAALQAIAVAATDAIEKIPQIVGQRMDEIAGIAVELGLAVAREIVGNALDKGLVDPTPTVARCLRDCVHGSNSGDLVVHLHPDDLALVQQSLEGMVELQEQLSQSRLVADRSIARGAVRAVTEAGRLHYDPRDALDRVSAEVRREVRA